MEDDEEQRVVAPRAGRRARAQAAREQAAELDDDGQQADAPPAAARRGGFGFDDPPDEAGSSAPPETTPAASSGNVPRGPPATASFDPESGNKFVGVSRRKQDQRAREEEEQEKAKSSKYDDVAKNIDGIMELEEEGKEDMSQMVRSVPIAPHAWSMHPGSLWHPPLHCIGTQFPWYDYAITLSFSLSLSD